MVEQKNKKYRKQIIIHNYSYERKSFSRKLVLGFSSIRNKDISKVRLGISPREPDLYHLDKKRCGKIFFDELLSELVLHIRLPFY